MTPIIRLSRLVAIAETLALQVLVGAIMLLMVTNVLFRWLFVSLYWADELAINLMVIFAFVGASLMFAQRRNFSVTLVRDSLGPGGRRVLGMVIDALSLLFALILGYACWLWFDPLTLARADFDLRVFFGQTFNSVYQETTDTIGLRRLWFFLVIPVFALTLALHSLAGLFEHIRNKEL